jgi:hypothetical protein
VEVSRDWRIAAGAVTGGALIATGAALPWLTLFAGLQSYSGMLGSYGRLLFAGGALTVAGGVTAIVRPNRWVRPVIGSLGALVALFTTWLLVGLRSITRALESHAVLLARPGAGLFVALAGAIIVAATVSPRSQKRAR